MTYDIYGILIDRCKMQGTWYKEFIEIHLQMRSYSCCLEGFAYDYIPTYMALK